MYCIINDGYQPTCKPLLNRSTHKFKLARTSKNKSIIYFKFLLRIWYILIVGNLLNCKTSVAYKLLAFLILQTNMLYQQVKNKTQQLSLAYMVNMFPVLYHNRFFKTKWVSTLNLNGDTLRERFIPLPRLWQGCLGSKRSFQSFDRRKALFNIWYTYSWIFFKSFKTAVPSLEPYTIGLTIRFI